MAKLIVTDLSGNTEEIEGETGISVMENIRDAGFEDLAAICGGCCSCCTCHVYVDAAWAEKLEEQSPDEFELVEFSEHYKENSRLSCQIEMTDDLDGIRVTLAPED